MQNNLSANLRARVALDKNDFRATHSLGQNFLLDEELLSRLIDLASVGEDDNVLEIGPGAGVMTALLCERAKNVHAVEIDEHLKPVLESVLSPYDNVKVSFVDFMKSDAENLMPAPYRVIANLPYYITADIILKLISLNNAPQSISIMVQKEAAERLMSSPGEKQWCALAAQVGVYGETEILEEVPPHCFEPAPHVMSEFIKITKHAEPRYAPKDAALFKKLILAAFAMRRKTLANNLKQSLGMNANEIVSAFEQAGLSDKIRGEVLTLDQFVVLSDIISNMRS